MNLLKKITPPLLALMLSNVAFAAGGTQSVNNLFDTILDTLQGVGLVVVTIAIMWAGYKVLFVGNTLQEVSKPLIGAILIGSAPWLAALFVG